MSDFPTDKFKPAKDRYVKARGGSSNFLYIECGNCDDPLMVYQKDGPGRLLRTYTDRILWPPELVDKLHDLTPDTIKTAGALACDNCENTIGVPMIYDAENRPAFRLIPGTIHAYRSPEQAQARHELSE